MADSWEDDDFEPPSFQQQAVVPSNWDDEEDLVEVEKNIVATPSESQIQAEKRRAEEADRALAAKLKSVEIANETADQRKLREKKQVEEADNEITGELFGEGAAKKSGSSSSSKGIGAILLKTKQDHTTFGNTIVQKLSDSSAFNVAAFFKSLSKTLDTPSMTTEVLDEILADISKIREAKAKVEKPAKGGNMKKSKKEIKAEEKRHADVFGGSEFVDKYDDQYGNMEDDFM